jgi:hypothetical protein
VEGGKQQLALAHVLGSVEEQQRTIAHDRAQHGVGLTGS